MEFKEDSENKEIYSFEQVLEMLCGDQYYSMNQINYVYYHINSHIDGYKDKADDFLKLCIDDANKLKQKYSKFFENDKNNNN